MGVKIKKKSMINKYKETPNQFAGSKLIQGPLDTFIHTKKSQSDLEKHRDALNIKMNTIDNTLNDEMNKYNKELENLANKKQQDAAITQQKKQERIQNKESSSQIEAQETERAMSTFWKLTCIVLGVILYIIEWIWFLIKIVLFIVLIILYSIFLIFYYIGVALIYIYEQIRSLLKELTVTARGGAGKLLTYILVIVTIFICSILVVILIILLILLIYYVIVKGEEFTLSGYKTFIETKFSGYDNNIDPNDPDKKSSKNKCTDSMEISISNFSDWTNFKYLPLNSYNYEIKRPNFPSIISFPSLSIFSPMKSVKQVANYCKGQAMKNRYLRKINYYFDYGNNLMSGGEINASKTNRPIIEDGRCDNIIIVDPKLMNAKLVKNRNINLAKNALNISRPLDIEWEMPNLDYHNKDVTELPPSLLEKKDKDGVSLKDKQTIIIPWIKKEDKYVLSCSDAYFKNSPNESANILIDNSDNTCIFNIQSKSDKYDEEKKRYSYSNDLSKFL